MLVTYTGKSVDYNNITKEMIDIKDIVLSLPRLNRFVGHSSRAYSVGEHTFFCLVMAEKLNYTYREQFLTLIHDFTECYVGDCPSPLKKLLPNFEEIEHNVELAICEYLEIEPPTEAEHLKVKRVDMTMLTIEMRELTLHNYVDFINEYTYMDMLNEEELVIGQTAMSEAMLRQLLQSLFNDLHKKVKEEQNNEKI